MATAKTIAKKLERARLNGKPSKIGIGGDLGDRCKDVTRLLAKLYGNPQRVEAAERDGDAVRFVRVVLLRGKPCAKFKTSVGVEHIMGARDEQIAEHVAALSRKALNEYALKPLGNARVKVAIEDELGEN